MFGPTNLYSKEAKQKNAEKLKEEKRRWKQEKLQREREASEYIKKKNQELNDLEQSFLEELSKRKPKKEEEKIERFFYVKKKKFDLPTFTSRATRNYILQGADSDNHLVPSSATMTPNPNPNPNLNLNPNTNTNTNSINDPLGKQAVPSSFNPISNNKLLILNNESHSNLPVPSASNPRGLNKLIRSDDGSHGKLPSGHSSSPFTDLEKNKLMLNPESKNTVSNSDLILIKNSNLSSPSHRVKSKPGLRLKNDFDSKFKFFRPAASNDLPSNEVDQRTEDLASGKDEANLSERKKIIEKNKKKFLPLILKPVNNGMFTVHIVGENSHGKVSSHNNTPFRGEDEISHSPYFHMFRDIEVINKSSNALTASKVRVMRDYDKEVKRFYTPKPNVKYNLRLENKKLEKYLENTVKRIKFIKIFK